MIDQEEISARRAELRREFPRERLPTVIDSKGRVSRSALAQRFSAMGYPNAKPEIAAAMIRSGLEISDAMRLAILANAIEDCSIGVIERITKAIEDCANREHASRAPWGKCAEDQAARFEDRASRWGTDEFHGWRNGSHRTNWYPFAPFGPVPNNR